MLNSIIGGLILCMIMSGQITSPNQLPEIVNETELQQLSGAMQIENGDNGDRCLLLTGAVILNRKNSPHWKGDTIEEVIMAKGQYASVTRNGFKTKKASERTILLAKYLLIYGTDYVCPSNVVYQGQGYNGSGLYEKINVPGQKPELFCFE